MYDCIVVGSGLAGLWVSLLVQEQGRVLLLTKAGLDDSNTSQAQGGIAAAVGAGDRPEAHWHDTLVAGAGLSDSAAAWVLCREGPGRVADLAGLGVGFDRECGAIALAREAAHSLPRVLHAGGDATGRHLQLALGNLVRRAGNITIREHHLVTEISTRGQSATGVVAIDCRSGETIAYHSRSVVLASGGAGQLYQQTTNPEVATGTGLALAYRVGAGIADLEFYQFHPTALQLPGAPRFLISEAARGEGGVLVDGEGRRFMPQYDPRAELAPRDVVAAAIQAQIERSAEPCVYLDLTHLPPAHLLHRFPTIVSVCRRYGLEPTQSPIPVAPAAHYMMGGVRTDVWGESSLSGLYACGEVACTGVHGANRLASNSLLEALVFGSRIARRLSSGQVKPTREPPPRRERPGSRIIGQGAPDNVDAGLTTAIPEEHRLWWEDDPREAHPSRVAVAKDWPVADLQALMWQGVGMQRSAQSLRHTARRLAGWASTPPPLSTVHDYERRDMLLAARLLTAAALAREETRGAHRRSDYPREAVGWRRRLVWEAPRAPRSRPAAAAGAASVAGTERPKGGER
ncbi:MAG: L-aspartate oxidase [Chloroflexota bacterium]